MWSQYDENLYENVFFKEIIENHHDLTVKAAEESWIICIPKSGSVELTDVTIDVILDHVLVPATEGRFSTLSKKSINVQNRHIRYNNNVIFSNNIEILFEETFYIEKTLKYVIWCIDQPLFIAYKRCNSHSSSVLENVHDCIDFLWAESLGHSILNNIRELCNNFIEQHADIEAECLQTQKEFLGNLFSKCLQMGLKNDVLKEKSNSNSFLENFKLAVETYMQYCLGRRLTFCVNTLQHQTDSIINKIIRNNCDIHYQDLGISNIFSDIISNAKSELSKINNYVTVLDKITCLRRTCNIIFESNHTVTCDDVLQILVFLILKLRVNNWSANLVFLKEFRLSSLDNTEKNDYFLTSLEAALEFLKSNKFLEIKDQIHSRLDTNQIAIKCIYDKIQSDEQATLTDMLNETKDAFKKELCHPLCTCESCLSIIAHQEQQLKMYSPEYCNEKGQNLLITASLMSNCEVVEFLVNHGFNVDSSDSYGRTSLHYAASHGFQNVLLLLINHNADVNALDNDKNTPLHLACQNGQDNCVKALLYSSGIVELNIGNFFGDTPLHIATKWGYFEVIKVLLENEASVVVKNKRNQLALNLAPNYYVLKLFERFGAQRSTTLAREIVDNHITVVQGQCVIDQCKQNGVEHGVRPKDVGQFKKIDLLLKAIESNDLPLTCFYLGFSCSPSTTAKSSTCHPLCSCEKCQTEQDLEITVPEINSQLINTNMCNVHGYTSLHIAAKYGRTQILRLLLDCGSLPNVQTYKTLYTPLHLACIFQRVQIVRELLKSANCKVDIQDVKGNTPLHYACLKNDLKIVYILLTNGADCNLKNYAGKSALQESEENMQYRVFKLMKNSLVNCFQTESYSSDLF